MIFVMSMVSRMRVLYSAFTMCRAMEAASSAGNVIPSLRSIKSDQVFLPIKGPHLPKQRIAEQHLLLVTLNRKIDVIRQRKINVVVQLFVHDAFGILDHLC